MFGCLIALVLSRPHRVSEPFQDWLHSLLRAMMMLPQAYFQAFAIILRPHRTELVVQQKVQPGKTAGLIFLDILITCFTPRTIVTRYDGKYFRLHQLERAGKQKMDNR